MVHIVNLHYNDIHLKAQAAYYQEFPCNTKHSTSCDLNEQYCHSWIPTIINDGGNGWTKALHHGEEQQQLMMLLNCIHQYDFSIAK